MDFFLRTKRDVNDPFQAEQGISTPYFWQDGTNDLQVDTNGDFALVQGVNCLSQEMCKILVTERGSNLFFSLYGTNLQNLIGQKLSLQEVQAKVTTEVTDGLQIYQYLNQSNPNLDEQITTLSTLSVTVNSTNSVSVQFNVITGSGKTVGTALTVG